MAIEIVWNTKQWCCGHKVKVKNYPIYEAEVFTWKKSVQEKSVQKSLLKRVC